MSSHWYDREASTGYVMSMLPVYLVGKMVTTAAHRRVIEIHEGPVRNHRAFRRAMHARDECVRDGCQRRENRLSRQRHHPITAVRVRGTGSCDRRTNWEVPLDVTFQIPKAGTYLVKVRVMKTAGVGFGAFIGDAATTRIAGRPAA